MVLSNVPHASHHRCWQGWFWYPLCALCYSKYYVPIVSLVSLTWYLIWLPISQNATRKDAIFTPTLQMSEARCNKFSMTHLRLLQICEHRQLKLGWCLQHPFTSVTRRGWIWNKERTFVLASCACYRSINLTSCRATGPIEFYWYTLCAITYIQWLGATGNTSAEVYCLAVWDL